MSTFGLNIGFSGKQLYLVKRERESDALLGKAYLYIYQVFSEIVRLGACRFLTNRVLLGQKLAIFCEKGGKMDRKGKGKKKLKAVRAAEK